MRPVAWIVLGAVTMVNTTVILWRYRHEPRRRTRHLYVVSTLELFTAMALWQHW